MSALQSTATASQPSLALFFDTVQAYQRAFILKTAAELDIFTLIAKGNQTAAQIAKTCNVPERGLRVICDCLTVIGFLNKNGNRYSLTSDSAMFLDSRSPAYMGKALSFLLDPSQIEKMQRLTESVRKGGGAADSFMAGEDRLWVEFARGMAPMMVPAAEAIAQVLRPALSGKTSARILDVAAGHGIFGITVAEHFQNAQIHALDSANVLKVAEENAAARGVRARYHLLPGSAFDMDWGNGYDAVLLTNFLHHFDQPTNVSLLKKAHAALKPGGQVVILDFVPNEDRVSPPIPAMFTITMFGGTEHGDTYTFSQFSQMCSDAGFKDAKQVQLQASPESLVAARKPE
ncbi:MAG TPA: class I SAM-dependent methyltransferase [Terriglobales bacterium]|nr:class I SAM-dependent methyltransferase [Terriglobales bacterium]